LLIVLELAAPAKKNKKSRWNYSRRIQRIAGAKKVGLMDNNCTKTCSSLYQCVGLAALAGIDFVKFLYRWIDSTQQFA